ncbi:MAG: inositol monophosphatase, partial [Chloroflexi bacterium]|nr:inositol monophosphatase [Chloroflexota bacterium]
EAGGTITTILGEPLKMQPKLDLVVSNGRIHTQMLRVLETVPPYT